MEYNGEKLSFGKNAYNGWVLNNQKDTIGRFYTARITKDAKNFYDVKLFAYLSKENQLNDFRNSKGEMSVLDLNNLLKDCECSNPNS